MNIAEKRKICMRAYEARKAETDARCARDIEAYRKGDGRLTVRNAVGDPVAGKQVRLVQKTHDFKYGANIFLLDEFSTAEENAAYRDMFAKYFNLATVPFYWQDLEPEQGKPRFAADSPKIYRRPAPDLCLDYCREKGILPKLHCLFYDKFFPTWLPLDDDAEMRRLYEKRFAEIAERYRGTMYEFEVINEMLCMPTWKRRSVLCDDPDIIEWAFRLAEKYLPGETLVINEANPISSVAWNNGGGYYAQIKDLLAKGTPVHKIGMQNHIFAGACLPAGAYAGDVEITRQAEHNMNPDLYFRGLDKFSELGLPLEMTEVTVATLGEGDEAEELQADTLEMLYTIWFSIPAMETVVYWNTVDYMAFDDPKGGWNENNCRGGLFHRDLTPKKAALRLYDLFHKKWHTDLTLTTDENGVIAFRGFFGDYELEIDGVRYPLGLHKAGDNDITLTI